ncbi:hypothetical protein EIP91_004399 [Steccherinum ochraceum]|uniref:RlpA-like protein double-psi beta-barrel domain-containing protein n=1 Tax=Steccherinum ochraceum TaxID=92696 RepID=A0A4R0RZY2_9APHY|nr:hypothetical protein EIP91_004399 [Steccherinum ochraceum]
MVSMISAITALALTITGTASAAFTGHAQWYFTGGVGFCGFPLPANKLVVAIATPVYNKGVNCGRTAQVNFQGKSVNVTVYDQNNVFVNQGDIDLSQTAYSQLTSLDNDGITVTWDFV